MSTDSEHHHGRRLEPLEWLTIAHVSVFAIATTWAFGGQADWIRMPLVAWGSLGAFITLAVLLNRERAAASQRVLWCLLPLVAFNAVTIAASFNPSFAEMRYEGEILLANMGANDNWPSSARPVLARQALWQFDAIWLACFNLLLVVRSRRALRVLLLLLCVNAFVLSVFGTVQKLGHAPGLYFGAVPSPQKHFFSTFVYHNHWGAFALLSLAIATAMVAHVVRRHQTGGFFDSPALTGLVGILFISATIPLSASRSSTILMTVQLGAVFVFWITTTMRKRRAFNESIAPLVVLSLAAFALGIGLITYLARDTIKARFDLSLQQIRLARTSSQPDARIQLYRDTFCMGAAKPWFGWGMGSFPVVFDVYNTRVSPDYFPIVYHDAHSDVLQAFAEHGLVGSVLLVLCAAVPLALLRRGRTGTPIPRHLLAGCAVLLLYALLEFPFGNYAVVLMWWICFFTALQYARLSGGAAAPSTNSP